MEITHKSCFLLFFVFRIHFHYVLSYLFGLFGVRTCVSILWHTSFWWFSCFWHDVTYDVTVTSYKVCLYFSWYQWTREGHSYPLVPHAWCFVNRFPRSWGRNPPPPPRLWDGSKKPGSFRVKCWSVLFMAHGFRDIIISFIITFLHDKKIICNTYHYEGHIGASK